MMTAGWGDQQMTGEDDGYGSFGGHARGDLAHEAANGGAGDKVNVHRIAKIQTEGDQAPISEILKHTSYRPDDTDDR